MTSINKLKIRLLSLIQPLLKVVPFSFRESNYSGSFIVRYPKEAKIIDYKANTVLYAFWTGNNELTENRLRCLESIKKNSGVPFVLVTPGNLEEYIVNEHPLHPAYEYLSLIHRSDYLRCYFMHHHG